MKIELDTIREFFMQRAIRFPEVGLFEFGIDRIRFDLILLDSHRKRIKGFEFKVNRGDFLRDKNSGKWKYYLNYCHTFTWVCPEGLIQKEEIEKPAGLLWIKEKKVNKCYDETIIIIDYEWKKRPSRLEISRDNFDKVLLLLINRVKYRKDDFF